MEIPADVSEFAWNTSRHILSQGFTTPIAHLIDKVISFARDIDSLIAYDFKFVTWEEFEKAEKPDGLLERATFSGPFEGQVYVVFDPLDDENGFLAVWDDGPELVRQACIYIAKQEPEDGPLSVDNLAKSVVES